MVGNKARKRSNLRGHKVRRKAKPVGKDALNFKILSPVGAQPTLGG